MNASEPVMVAESEHAMLSIARAMVGELPPRAVHSILLRARELPKTIDARSMDVLKQTLAIGVPLTLVRRGGFEKNRQMGPTGVSLERAFERNDLALHFSEETFHLLTHLVEKDVSTSGVGQSKRKQTVADQIAMSLAADLVQGVTLPRGGRLAKSAVCWFSHLPSVAKRNPESGPRLQGLIECPAVIESLARDWARRWVAADLSKSKITSCDQMIALGHAQGLLLGSFFDAIDAAGRRDLCRFFVDAIARLLIDDEDPLQRVAALKLDGEPLSRRAEAYRAAAASYAQVERLATWAGEAGAVHFIDDGHDAAQLFLSIWEEIGADGLTRCRERVSALEAVHSV